MGSLVIVEPEVGSHFTPCFGGVGVGFQAHFLLFQRPRIQRPPQPRNEYVGGVPTLPVPADLHPVFRQRLGEFQTGQLAALVSVEDLRLDLPDGLLQGIDAEAGSRVLDNRQVTTYRRYQSMMATKLKPR